jgi:hypothetical protein
MRRALIGLAMFGAAALATSAARAAEEKPSATLTLSEGSLAAGIGFSWGSGVLTYQGKRHRFKVSGLSVNALGMSKVEATGNVYNLDRLEAFEGTYTSIGVSSAAGGGGGISTMKNQHGVRIVLRETSQGLAAQAGPDGVTLTLEK